MVLLGSLGLATAGNAFPMVTCAFNQDQSSVTVVASYPEDNFGNEYTHHGPVTCQTSRLVKAAGERVFSSFPCNFALNVNAPEKVVCEQKGAGPGAFVDLRSKGVICVPR